MFSNNEITWESLLREIVKQEGFNPWDVNVSALTEKYVKTLKQLEKLDFKLSGKVLLAASILLKIKSDHIIEKKVSEEQKEKFMEEISAEELEELNEKKIVPRIPLPKKRRVTLNELVDSLKKAIEVKERRVRRHRAKKEKKIEVEVEEVDIVTRIKDLYERILKFFKKKKEVFFHDITPSNKREDVVDTYIPLVFMANENKVDLEQEELFGEIRILKK